MSTRKFTKELWEVDEAKKCPGCGNEGRFGNRRRFLRIEFKLTTAQGTPLPQMQLWQFPDDAYLQCKTCGHRFPVFTFAETPETSLHVVEIVETHGSETISRKDTLRIGNTNPSTQTRRAGLEETWTQSWDVEYEKATKTGTSANIDIDRLAGLKKEFETQIRNRYVNTESLIHTYTDEVTFEVPPHNDVVILVIWKRIWQHGLFKLSDGTEVPFKVAVRCTYDTSSE